MSSFAVSSWLRRCWRSHIHALELAQVGCRVISPPTRSCQKPSGSLAMEAHCWGSVRLILAMPSITVLRACCALPVGALSWPVRAANPSATAWMTSGCAPETGKSVKRIGGAPESCKPSGVGGAEGDPFGEKGEGVCAGGVEGDQFGEKGEGGCGMPVGAPWGSRADGSIS